ncbi:unnamed protein product [Closterium sp. Yama58-4]|nr:unnamed protein product [Closterium sp. Yama58-4]
MFAGSMQIVEHFHEKLLLPDEEFALLEAAVAAAEREAAARKAARAGSSAEVVAEHPRVDRGESAHARNDARRCGGRSEFAGSSAAAASPQKSLLAWMRPEALFEAPFQAPKVAEPATSRSLFPDIEDVAKRDALSAECTRGVAAGADGCAGEREAGTEARGLSTEARGTGSEERGTQSEAREAREGALEVRARHVARRPLDCKHNQRLSVTDITDAEWCEQRVVFSLSRGKPLPTAAMRAGAERHAALEREVVEAVEVAVETREDAWALRLLGAAARVLALGEALRGTMGGGSGTGFERSMGYGSDSQAINSQSSTESNESDVPMLPAPQPHSTRRPGRDGGNKGGAEGCGGGCGEGGGEGGAGGGVGEGGSGWRVMVVDTKTRVRPRPPRTAQSRNSRLQLMCYSALLSSMIQHGVPQEPFFSCFRLHPHTALSPQVLEHAAEVFPRRKIACLADVTSAVSHAFQSLQPLHSTLLLRYEWQADGSLICEDRFAYDPHWLQASIATSLEFWLGRRRPFFVPREEAWKCSWCSFAPVCRPDLRWKGQAGQGGMPQT